MKKLIIPTIAGVCFLLLTCCAPVKFYSNSELTKKSGFKYYTVKPYLQVERDQSNNSIVKATILYLPDLENPQYIAIKEALSSNKLDLKITDGSINTLSLDTEPKIAETINSLGGLVSKTAEAVTDLTTLKSVPHAGASLTITELYDIVMSNGLTSFKRIEFK
jgi:hypothetical protein